ncbi:MAG: hypothetical protein LBT09_06205 [Planctomycetaceae bacterium]|jgi:hypothetical protein|nr:hypothetical protein [Planctomycetaceae bacterium]
MIKVYDSLITEIYELEKILSNFPADRVIDRMSFEARLKSVKEELAQLPQQEEKTSVRLTFKGKPVWGSHGIEADFGSKATALFSDAFSMVMSDANRTLSDCGPIPGKDAKPLFITGIAVGSFGFEFELPPKDKHLFPDLDPSENAIKKIENLFRLAADGSDDDIAEQIVDMQQRTISKVHEFLNFMVQQGAWCGLEFEDTFFQFTDLEQIKKAENRLSDNNINESDESLQGEFQGILPKSRTFEFNKQSFQENVIRGKIDRAIVEPDILNREWLHRPVTTKFHVVKVGQGYPKYTLLSLDDISDDLTVKSKINDKNCSYQTASIES